MELIFEEFSELLLSFLIKREKENMSLKEIDLTERMAVQINKIIRNLNQKQLKISKNQPQKRYWPLSEKDKV
jgi:hypothetical protein